MSLTNEIHELATGQPIRFDLDGAQDAYLNAAASWAALTVAQVVGVATAEDVDTAWTRLHCAAAVLAWEHGRTAFRGLVPGAPWVPTEGQGADYDDETIDALLRGAR
ncbi:hypothetical protein [Mycolicibacterium nivoides]|uniref:DUF2742 domain-containing protein n=1 Tax=Mycolicibacterium nivoides TaxID=2487344 RepID=A0ABW9L7I0_9MYCO